ncbi:hypothetical protein NC652_037939 [Populus alba x Populus x berolinensis]|nr:hypothetical protein NC652_037939 [Populus alba x Populus x berolinensis]
MNVDDTIKQHIASGDAGDPKFLTHEELLSNENLSGKYNGQSSIWHSLIQVGVIRELEASSPAEGVGFPEYLADLCAFLACISPFTSFSEGISSVTFVVRNISSRDTFSFLAPNLVSGCSIDDPNRYPWSGHATVFPKSSASVVCICMPLSIMVLNHSLSPSFFPVMFSKDTGNVGVAGSLVVGSEPRVPIARKP